MAEEQQNSGHSNGGSIIPTPEEVATFLPKTVAEGDSHFPLFYILQLKEISERIHYKWVTLIRYASWTNEIAYYSVYRYLFNSFFFWIL